MAQPATATFVANNTTNGGTTTMSTPAESFEHINLNDVDSSFDAVDPNVYTLEINKLEPVYRTIKKPDSPFVNQQVLVLRGTFQIVEDEKYAGRRIFRDFWTPYKGAQVSLKKLMVATGVNQTDGQSLSDWANGFATLNPPARLQAPVTKEADKRDPDGAPVNDINFFQSKPV